MTDMAEPNADSVPAEGWYLTKARPVPGYAGSASGAEHYFRDGHSLCGRRSSEAIDNIFLGPQLKPMFFKSCKLCHRKLAAQIGRSETVMLIGARQARRVGGIHWLGYLQAWSDTTGQAPSALIAWLDSHVEAAE